LLSCSLSRCFSSLRQKRSCLSSTSESVESVRYWFPRCSYRLRHG
jgi:hypothetical protein